MPESAIHRRRSRALRATGVRTGAGVIIAAIALLVPVAAPAVASAGGWTQQDSGTTTSFKAVDFADATHGWAVGEAGMVRSTSNGGSTWAAQASGVSQGLYGVDFADATRGWAVGDGGVVIATANGGSTWVRAARSSQPSTAASGGTSKRRRRPSTSTRSTSSTRRAGGPSATAA